MAEIKWDKYEAALLLEASLEVITDASKQTEAIKRVSKLLRQGAKKRGAPIDDKYRNENDVGLQMLSMISLLKGKKSIWHSSRLFRKLVNLYKTDPSSYERILQEAKSRYVTSDLTRKPDKENLQIRKNNKDAFFKWLADRVPAFQISDYFLLYRDIDNFCSDNALLRDRLLETNDVALIKRTRDCMKEMGYLSGVKKRNALDFYISYLEEQSSQSTMRDSYEEKPPAASPVEPSPSDIAQAESAFEDWLVESGVSFRTAHSYTLAVANVNKHMAECGIYSGNLLTIEDTNVLNQLILELYGNAQFQECDSGLRSRITSTISKLFEFRKSTEKPTASLRRQNPKKALSPTPPIPEPAPSSPPIAPEPLPAPQPVQEPTPTPPQDDTVPTEDHEQLPADDDLSAYREVLAKKFPHGFRMDILEIKRFRRYWEELYHTENPLSNGMLRNKIAQIDTFSYEEMSYLPEAMVDAQAKEKLLAFIRETFASGKTAVLYYDALYQKFEADLRNITSAGMLRAYLKHINNGKYFLHERYLAASWNAKEDSAAEIRAYLLEQGTPLTIDEIASGLPHLSEQIITKTLTGVNSEEFVCNKKGNSDQKASYFHADLVEFSDTELATIKSWISRSIEQDDFISGKEVIDLIDAHLPDIRERMPFLTDLGLRNALAYQLRDSFSFKAKIISAYGKSLDMPRVFMDYGKNHTPFTFDQLEALAKSMGTPIVPTYFDALYTEAIRISATDFISRNAIHFAVSDTDEAIAQFCTGDFVPLQEVNLFDSFPDCGYPWNIFLLESYVAQFSQKFKLVHPQYTKTKALGAIVKKGAEIENWVDLFAIDLAQSDVPLTANDALEYFCEVGYWCRKSCSKIDEVVRKAKTIRAKEGA